MLAEERRNLILSDLQKNKMIKVSEIAERYHVTVETARRDIAALQEMNVAKKIYGGAMLATRNVQDSMYASRTVLHIPEKEAIGKLAATLVHDNETIMLGSGTTTLEIAKNIKHIRGLTVITNSIPVILELLSTEIHLICIGGEIRNMDKNMIGSFSLNALDYFHMDSSFITALGISQQTGVTTFNMDDALFAQRVQRHSSQTVLVADSSKFGQNSSIIQGPISHYDIIVTDSHLPAEYRNAFSGGGSHLMIAPI